MDGRCAHCSNAFDGYDVDVSDSKLVSYCSNALDCLAQVRFASLFANSHYFDDLLSMNWSKLLSHAPSADDFATVNYDAMTLSNGVGSVAVNLDAFVMHLVTDA